MVIEQSPSSSFQGRINPEQLIYDLWVKKWLILSFMLISLILGFFLIRDKQNHYEATAYIDLPTESDIIVFNTERAGQLWVGKNFLTLLEPHKDLIFVNLKVLISDSIKQKFFENYYLPAFLPSNNKIATDKIFKQMEQKIVLKEEHPGITTNSYILTVRGNSPVQVKEWANNYILLAQNEIRKRIEDSSKKEIQVLLENLNRQISITKKYSKSEREDRIVQLEEALKLSQTIEKNREGSPSNTSLALAAIAASQDKNLTFIRGSKVLQSEIELLNHRDSDDAHTSQNTGLRKLEKIYNFYKNLKFNPKSIPVIQLSNEVVTKLLPNQKNFILCLFAVAGFMLGAFIVLLGSIIKQLRKN